jgi:26S proteasome regulatory subunit T3
MADVAVENPANTLPPHKNTLDSMPEIDSFEGVGANGEDEYSTLKRLQRHLEYVLVLMDET